ncbi:hypothetical protein CALCODRAFT_470248 [Calocera cornea HHB12733]|uniref:UPF3 domain-containing protein n=1 Tax=Calocera cornea HHB12733 TaxID=1353952 RepID=A0A165FND7_9BASI|nr:hypothetical protein CALCODRAFT_470248 [Calocera cornea HHB12733]
MATPSSPAAPTTAPIKAPKKRKGQEPSAARLKVIVRRLPPNLPEAIFWKSVEPWVSEESIAWRTFYPGKVKPKLERENVPSRAYIMFKTPEQVAQFSGGYNGHVFRDKQGHESQAVVEFAPYQKAPGINVKPDARQGTIEQDPDFLSFLNNLNAPVEHESLASLEKGTAQAPEREVAVSPLIAALIQQKKSSKAAKAAKAAVQAPTVASRQAAAVASQQAALQAAQEEKSLYSRRLPGEAGPSNEQPKSKKNKGNPEVPAGDEPARKRPVVGQMRQFEAALGAAVNPGGQPRKERTPSSSQAPAASISQPAQPSGSPAPGKSKKAKGKGGGQAAQGGGGGPSQPQGGSQPRAEPGQGSRGRGRGRGGGPTPQAQTTPAPGMIQIASRPQPQAGGGGISRIDQQQPNQPLYGSSGRASVSGQAPIGAGEGGGSDGRPVRNAAAQQMMERLRTGPPARGRGRGSGGRGGAPGAGTS